VDKQHFGLKTNERIDMKVKEIPSDIYLLIAPIEVELNGDLRTSPTLCAVILAEGHEQEKSFPSTHQMVGLYL